MTAPLVQLYCKRLDDRNVDEFLFAEPDHVGWQINLAKLAPGERETAVDRSARMVERLAGEGVRSVFLIHPSTDASVLIPMLDRVRPDIFLASAERTARALEAVRRSATTPEIMVPIGIPVRASVAPGYEPEREVATVADYADWYTTDTITPVDTPERFGCSGQTSDWGRLVSVVAFARKPVVVAGGLHPGNVALLWKLCRPKGFDAHTSVCTDGIPDREKSLAFAAAVRSLAH
ncbi:hypothetical protein ACIQW5_28860 [Methylorubrum thiocyanatum]|uniref:phosphoribosylanthranilate isomerase n=1 Tax=Methylorubrum thiocyanatum TaxID=47958 RepID=UPI00383A321C